MNDVCKLFCIFANNRKQRTRATCLLLKKNCYAEDCIPMIFNITSIVVLNGRTIAVLACI